MGGLGRGARREREEEVLWMTHPLWLDHGDDASRGPTGFTFDSGDASASSQAFLNGSELVLLPKTTARRSAGGGASAAAAS